MTQAANRLPAPAPEPKILGGGEHGFTFLGNEPSRIGTISGGVTATSVKGPKTEFRLNLMFMVPYVLVMYMFN
jgi:hypothetical protein